MSKFSEQNRTEQNRTEQATIIQKPFLALQIFFQKKLYLYSLTILSALSVLVNSRGAIHVYL